ncbi:hypothetical protein RJ639_036626 [Escallonia herrerae]|uniref:5-formyltetrahydrofolate cyclo-ligase n=1 Tax=Escallonia herrerae TaxID=1293975 RepID=A0AA88WPH8_9ASTE|nr:hypothetical protein RJ639_036626 [Escallonia herrerae]
MGFKRKARQLVAVLMSHPRTIATAPTPASFFLRPIILRPPPHSYAPRSTMTTQAPGSGFTDLDATFKLKRALRFRVRKDLKSMDPALRSLEVSAAVALGWSFTDGKKLYVPRVEDKNSHMRMLHITNINDLIANSMDILEPAPVDAAGNELEDGLAFDKTGRRLGRGGGYYDTLLTKYQELAKERKWKQPLLIALSYSPQIMDEDVIPLTPNDVAIDALVSPSGVIPINPAAFERRLNHVT